MMPALRRRPRALTGDARWDRGPVANPAGPRWIKTMGEIFFRLNVRAGAMAGGALSVLAFAVCVTFGLLFPASGPMRQLMEAALPGFTWLTFGTFLIGVVESFLYGCVGAGLAAAFYNFFGSDRGNRPLSA